jgi:hypothetical protein
MPGYLVFMDTDRSRAQAISDRLVATRRAHRRAEHQLATLLAELAEGRLYTLLGYASLDEYAETVLDLSPRQFRDLLRIGRALPKLPTLAASLEAGEIDWTKARELLRVATLETEAAWVERARAVPSRVLEREVTYARVGEPPPAGDLPLHRRPARERMVIELESADRELFDTMLAMLAAKLGTDGKELDRGALVGAAAQMVIERIEREEAGDDAPPTGERHRVVIDHCPACRDNTIRTFEGVREVSETVAAEAACDAEVVEMRPGPSQGHATRTIPPAMRRKVLHRAGWRCEVPYCRSRLWLDIHHVDAWANGGTHALGNLACVCSAHHRAIHEGILSLERGADGRVRVTRWNGQVHHGPAPRGSEPEEKRVSDSDGLDPTSIPARRDKPCTGPYPDVTARGSRALAWVEAEPAHPGRAAEAARSGARGPAEGRELVARRCGEG